MSTEKQDTETKPHDNSIEMSTNPHKEGILREQADYSGAVSKSSPEEIALVRKLDVRIMVSTLKVPVMD